MNSNNITTIIVVIIIVIGGGYFVAMNMGWNTINTMMDDEHNHEDHLHDEDIEDKTEIKISSNDDISGPKITLDRTLHKFGVIPQYGGTVEAIFTVKNEGTEVLEIGDITTSCSCTSATISSSSIPADGQAILTVAFDPDFHEEPLDVFKRTVFIPTNDPNNLELEVAIEVDINEGK
jgi:hypothetical protein